MEEHTTSWNIQSDIDMKRLRRSSPEMHDLVRDMRDSIREIDIALTRCNIGDGMRQISKSVDLVELVREDLINPGSELMRPENKRLLKDIRAEATRSREYIGNVGERFHGRCRCDRR